MITTSIQYLEYETVLGPEDDDEKPVAPQGGSGSDTTDGTTSGNVDNVGQSSGRKGIKLSAMGAGLGDLLTQGESSAVRNRKRQDETESSNMLIMVRRPSQVFDLPQPPNAYDERIDRMTEMLVALLQAQQVKTLASSPRGQRDSLQTYVGDSHANGYKPTMGLDENIDGGVRGAYANNGLHSLGDGHTGPNHGGIANVTGETTLAGEAQRGVPLGRRL